MDQIHPFNLLGVTYKDNSEKVKKNFKELALLCHPDKGGSKDDMIVLYKAYKYVLEQIEYGEHGRTFEEEKRKFSEFLEKKEEFPTIFDILTDGANKKFNEMWENSRDKIGMCYKSDYEKIMKEKPGSFSRVLVEYKEPKSENEINFKKELEINAELVKDFSGKDAADYILAFSELEKRDDFEEKDVLLEYEKIKNRFYKK